MSEETIFLEAIAITDPERRKAHLHQICEENHTLRKGVEELLKAHESDDLIDQPLGYNEFVPTIAFKSAITGKLSRSKPLELLAGRYRLAELMGEGGMGSVYKAEQLTPVQRHVAVKLIRPGMDCARVLARFESERQALAVMDHPGIAKVLDAGTLSSGQPFFVMELVEGLPLTRYCDDRKLTITNRIQLFIQVCKAVQHAHLKGIIHRDLKPGNILVTEIDSLPVAKVIDFGLAKALATGVLPNVTVEGMNSVLGTPLYMAPEQAEGSADVDTRADVYALGAILYELLTGSTPIDADTLRTSVYSEMLRVIRDVEPPTPRVRLSKDDTLPARAALRQIEPERLKKLVRGDLEWVTMKCLEKNRNRRYDTASGLMLDLERYLTNEPVTAAPPSHWYKATKFAHRNRVAVLLAGGMLLTLVGGVIGTTWGLFKATAAQIGEEDQRRKAETREKEAEAAAILAKKAAQDSEQVSTFLVGLFESRDRLAFSAANLGMRNRPTENPWVKDFLKLGIERLNSDSGLKELPLVRARLLHEIAAISLSLGELEAAEPMGREALNLRRQYLPPSHPDVLKSLRQVAVLEYLDGAYVSCLGRLEEVLALLDLNADRDNPEIAETEAALGAAIGFTDRQRAVPHLQRAFDIYTKLYGASDLRTVSTGWLLASVMVSKDLAGSLALAAQLQKDLETSAVHQELQDVMRFAIRAALATGSSGELMVYRDLVAALTKAFGDDHWVTHYARTKFAGLLYDNSANESPGLEEAAANYEKLVAKGPRWERNYCRFHLGRTYMRMKRYEDAERCLEVAAREYRRECKEISANHLPHALQLLAWLYDRHEIPEKAKSVETILRESVEIARNNPMTSPARLGANMTDLARYLLARRPDLMSDPIFAEAIIAMKKAHGANDLRYLEAVAICEVALRGKGESTEADALRKELDAAAKYYTKNRQVEAVRIRQLLKGSIPLWQGKK